jgi:hypothetical protein
MPRRNKYLEGYEQVYDGSWVPMAKKGQELQCCDCGLVHRIDFRVSSVGRIDARFYRDNRLTASARRLKTASSIRARKRKCRSEHL